MVTHSLEGNVTGLLWPLDTVTVVLVGLVVGGVVGGLSHVCKGGNR